MEKKLDYGGTVIAGVLAIALIAVYLFGGAALLALAAWLLARYAFHVMTITYLRMFLYTMCVVVVLSFLKGLLFGHA